MTGIWRKLGRVYCPPEEPCHPKLLTHAANPTAVHLETDIYRVFFNGRDEKQRSSIGAVDIDLSSRSVVQEFESPFFQHGPIGSFYSNGISLGNVCEIRGERFLFYMGWQPVPGGRWRGLIGKLIVRPDATLQSDCCHPFLSINEIDPISLSYPWALEQPDGTVRMWYGVTHNWDAGNGEMLHVVHESSVRNGGEWKRHGQVLEHQLGRAQAFSRPSIVRNQDGSLEMWVSYRGGPDAPYQIGYAKSADGSDWDWRPDEAGISVSRAGWDSEMIEYPFVFDHQGTRWMLYNGNGFGRTGFGLAVWEHK